MAGYFQQNDRLTSVFLLLLLLLVPLLRLLLLLVPLLLLRWKMYLPEMASRVV